MARDMVKYKATLREMISYLKESPRNAKDLAEKFQCTTQSIYNRLRDIADMGERIVESKTPAKRGPPVRSWAVTESADDPA